MESPLPAPSETPSNSCEYKRQPSYWSFGLSPSTNGNVRTPLPKLLGIAAAKQGQDPRSRSCSPATSRRGAYLGGDGDSIMGEVQDRIRKVEQRKFAEQNNEVMQSGQSVQTNMTGKTIPSFSCTELSEGSELKPRRCRIPFRPAIISTVAFGALLTCTLMFLPLYEFTTQLQTQTAQSFDTSVNRQFGLVGQLTSRAALASQRSILSRISGMLSETVMEPPERAISALWGSMQTSHAFDPAWTGMSDSQRAAISYRAFLELSEQQMQLNHTRGDSGAADFLYVGFPSGDFAGTSLGTSLGTTPKAWWWWDCPAHASSAESTFAQLNIQRWDPDCSAEFPLQRPWYTLQSKMAEKGGPLKRLWSGLYVYLDGTTIGLTKTAPVAYCGDYSCFQGVIAADITLKNVGHSCDEAFDALKEQLIKTYQFPITHSNAAVFVVSHKSRAQRPGVLVAASGLNLDRIITAEESDQVLVRRTSQELLRRFGQWDAQELQEEQLFRFRPSNDGFKECGEDFSKYTDPECLQVGTLSVRLDEADRWLVVVVSPAAAFFVLAKHIEENVIEELEVIDTNMATMGMTILQSAALAFFITTGITVGIGFGLGTAVSSPLRELTGLLRRLGQLDFGKINCSLQAKNTSSIRDICEVQDAFCRLSMGIQTFARFVPEAVVQNIIKGDCRAARLYVAKRNVTIMFSDIKDFTTMSESMKQTDLIFVLTRYLSIMGRIVETFGGVVAEILGDGLLVYWNTPLDTEDHAARACAAAVAMQQALIPLNQEIQDCDLQPLQVRIGVNTGDVLSGTFGSDLKMKFGCMGDPVNLASRLEGLCKTFDVGIIVSGTTYEHIANSSFICRPLDLVQVKGRKEPAMVYQVMGVTDLSSDWSPCHTESLGDSPIRHKSNPVMKTFSRDSKDSRRSNASRVSEIFFTKSPSQVALEALEESRQGLGNFTGLNWKQVFEQKVHAAAAARKRPAASQASQASCGNPTSPMPRSITSHSILDLVASPDVDNRLQELARCYEAAFNLYQAWEFSRALDKVEELLLVFPEDGPTKRLKALVQQKLDKANQPDLDLEEPFTRIVSVMAEKG